MHAWKLAVDTCGSHSDWHIVHYVAEMTLGFSAAQTSRAFHSAHIPLRVNERNDGVVTEKNKIQ